MHSPEPWIIRDAKLNDASRIAEIHVQAWKESYREIVEHDYLNSLSFEEKLKERLELLTAPQERSKTLVACNQEGKIIGFCDFGITRKGKSDAPGEIYMLYILKPYQSSGIGSTFWKKSVQYFHEHALIPFSLSVLENNLHARKFYEKKGGALLETQILLIGSEHYRALTYIFY